MSTSTIFRKESLDRLSSPEQLDMLMQVTNSKGWIALTGLILLVTTAVMWGFYGSIPTRVQGTGVLMKTGGVYEVIPLASGQVRDISVRPGDVVKHGQVVAMIDQPLLKERIYHAKVRLSELQSRHSQMQNFSSNDTHLQTSLANEQRNASEFAIRSAREQLRWLQEKLTNQQALLDQGLITEQTLLNTKQQMQTTQERIEQLENERQQVTIRHSTTTNQRSQDLNVSSMQITELEREIKQMEDEYAMSTEVRSPTEGRILEIMAEVGSMIGQGAPMMRLDRAGEKKEDLEAVVYIPASEGKKVKKTMDVQVAPMTIKAEEHGYMEGTVTRVSDFPATPEGMTRTLKNNQLIQTLAGGSAPYETYIKLKLDQKTPSGYKWTSAKGPETTIQSGTLCSVIITVEKERPIDLVMPFLKKLVGLA